MKNSKTALIVLSLAYVAVALIFYGPFLGNFFFYDDFKHLANIVTGPWAVALGYGNLRVTSNFLWLPLHALSGFNPLGYSLFSILLHSANAVLLYLFLSRLFSDKTFAFFGSAIFLVSSAGCDAIFWKCADSGLINVFFYLVALYTYAAYRQEGLKRHYVLSALFFAFAMFSKEEAASFPLILLLMEVIFFDGLKQKKAVLFRAAPFILIVLVYLLASKVVFDYILHSQTSFAGILRFSPLYSLLGGLSVFSLNPNSAPRLSGPALYLTVIVIVLAYFWVRDKRIFLFGCIWILLSFIPQSMVAQENFDRNPYHNLIQSMSRYLYITTIGSSIILASVITSIKNRFSTKAYYTCAVIIMGLIVFTNYVRVETRGAEWRDDAELIRVFLNALKKEIPEFPPNSYVAVMYAPMEHTQSLSALHAYYNNTDIHWVENPTRTVMNSNEKWFIIMCNWKKDGSVHLDFALKGNQ